VGNAGQVRRHRGAVIPAQRCKGRSKKECSFLKKRTKKLLTIGGGTNVGTALNDKSFLLLFFKKEVLLAS
jgi:hypothetical protein